MVRPMSAQEEHDEVMAEAFKKMKKETQQEKMQAQKRLRGYLRDNEGRFSKDTSSLPKDLVEGVMQRYGFTREKAEEMIEKFGG